MSPQLILWSIFGAIMIAFLVIDLGVLSRKTHAVAPKEAGLQSLFWVAISLAYAACVAFFMGHAPAADFLAAYLTEKMLSVDNLFVILLIFTYFKVKDEYRHRILYWGIMGALILRGLFIGAGTAVIGHFHWLLYIFGAFLVWSGYKLLKGGDDDEEFDGEKNKVFSWCAKHWKIDFAANGPKFFPVINGQKMVSILFVVLLIIETTDLLFAFDSIPAVFAITQDPLIAFTSNIFAVMGLRALFFLVEAVMKKLRYLQQGLSFVLIFIGGKMLADIVHVHISSVVSLCVVAGSLVIAAIASLLNPEKDEE